MGHAHSYGLSSDIKRIPEEALKIIKQIMKEYKEYLSLDNGIMEEPIVNEKEIIFNGYKEHGYECFYFGVDKFDNRIKTNHSTYDQPISKILLTLFHYIPEFKLESDAFWVNDGTASKFRLKKEFLLNDMNFNLALYWAEKNNMDFDWTLYDAKGGYHNFKIYRKGEISKEEEVDNEELDNLYYINIAGLNSVNVNTDCIVLDQLNRVVFASLYDAPALVDKLSSDVLGIAEVSFTLRKRNDRYFSKMIKFEGFFSKLIDYDRENGKRKHVVFIAEKEELLFVPHLENKTEILKSYVSQIHKIPCDNKLIESNMEYFKELNTLGHNKALMQEIGTAYYFNIDGFKKNAIKCEVDFLPGVTSVNSFIGEFPHDVFANLGRSITPLYNRNRTFGYEDFLITPKKGQEVLWGAMISVLEKDSFVYAASEMGTGKTLASLVTTRCIMKRQGKTGYAVLITAPAITLNQSNGGWKNEIDLAMTDTDVFGNHIKKDYDIYIITSAKQAKIFQEKVSKGLINLRNPVKPTFVCITKEIAKLSYTPMPSYLSKEYFTSKYHDSEGKEKVEFIKENYLICPDCGKRLGYFKKGMELDLYEHDFYSFSEEGNQSIKPNSSNKKCNHCGTEIFSAYKCNIGQAVQDTVFKKNMREKYKNAGKMAMAEFLKKQHIKFDMSILDEVHEGNKAGSLISRAQATCLSLGKKKIALSGTSNSGYSSNLFAILRAVIPNKLVAERCMEQGEFIDRFGVKKRRIFKEENKKSGRVEERAGSFAEIEGISPELFTRFLAPNFVFFKLKDIKEGLPGYSEKYIPIEADYTYDEMSEFFAEVNKLSEASFSLFKDSVFKHMVNNPYGWQGNLMVPVKKPFQPLVHKSLPFPEMMPVEDYISAKDEKALELALDAKSRGRKFCICNYFNGFGNNMTKKKKSKSHYQGRAVTERLIDHLSRSGLKIAWLTANSLYFNGKKKKVQNIDRERALDAIKDQMDGFICEPVLINVGLNLKWCPTFINFMPTYRVDIISQANRRGYRIGSKQDNEIYHLYYKNTIEEQILNRLQRKRLESQAAEANYDVMVEEDKDLRTYSGEVNELYQSLKGVEHHYESAVGY